MAERVARVLVVEDNPDLRELLVMSLEREGWDVRSAGDALEGEREALAFGPDIAILDVHLGDGPDGFTLARRLRQQGNLPFVFLTDRSDVEDRLTGFETGAEDYMAKPFVLAELVARLRVVLRRRPEARDEIIEVDGIKIDTSGRRVFVDGDLVDLTRIEFELLTVLAGQLGRVASKPELLGQVWGFEGYDANLVEVHISSLRRKLGGSGRLIETVRGAGYVLRAT